MAKIKANPLLKGVDPKKVKPRVMTLTQSTYDGVLYNTETIKGMLDGYVENLHFDEAWLPHAAFHPFLWHRTTRWAKSAHAPKSRWCTPPSPSTSCWPVSAKPAMCWCKTRKTPSSTATLFNEAYLMHTSTSPQYSIIASCDVAAAMMEPPGGTALVEESIAEALDFRRAMRKVDDEYGKDWWFKVWGPDEVCRRRHWPCRQMDLAQRPAQKSQQVAWLWSTVGRRLQHAGPDQVHHRDPGLEPGRQVRQDRHSGLAS